MINVTVPAFEGGPVLSLLMTLLIVGAPVLVVTGMYLTDKAKRPVLGTASFVLAFACLVGFGVTGWDHLNDEHKAERAYQTAVAETIAEATGYESADLYVDPDWVFGDRHITLWAEDGWYRSCEAKVSEQEDEVLLALACEDVEKQKPQPSTRPATRPLD